MTTGNGNRDIAMDAFQEYWKALQSACREDVDASPNVCPVPQRRAFNPMKIHRYLQHVYIGELKSDDFLEVRLAGTGIDEAAGFSVKGGNYLELCPASERQFYVAICKAVVAWPCGMKMVRSVTHKSGRVHQYSTLSFPLADRNGVPKYIVGMANVVKDVENTGFPPPEEVIWQINDFKFLDIGAGMPPLPDILRL